MAVAGAQPPHPAMTGGSQVERDSTHNFVLWTSVVRLASTPRAADVSFVNGARNIITSSDVVWMVDAARPGLTASASRPIEGTAAAGEAVGRRGDGLLRHPVALAVTPAASYVLEQEGLLRILRAPAADSVRVPSGSGAGRDIAVPTSGLAYVLMGNRVHVYADRPRALLWSFDVDTGMQPIALAANSKGDLFIVGHGKQTLGVFELDGQGRFGRTRSATAAALGIERAGGVALNPPMLLPIEGKEGWVGEDRFIVLSDPAKRALVAVDAQTLHVIGRWETRSELPAVVPGRLDVNNRGQIAVVDEATGNAYALPTRILAQMLRSASIRWRIIPPDSSAAVQSSKP